MADTKDEKTLLTIGEAAELAGVALLDLRRHIRAGRLKTTRAQRLGDELDLLSLKQLIHVCPSAGRREYRPELSLRERGIELVVRDMQVPQLLLLKPHLESEAKPLEAREPAPAEERALPQVGLEVEQLERQIEALKAQVQRARERNQSYPLPTTSPSKWPAPCRTNSASCSRASTACRIPSATVSSAWAPTTPATLRAA